MLVAAATAIAQVASQEFSERRITGGKASPSVSISSTGDNVNMCPTVEQVANTGNVANQQGMIQYDIQNPSDIDFMGSPLIITPDVTETCEQTLSQAAAAG